ncbi:MAG: hypothetical protein FJ301_02535 [Planctomycetes bacterium]|nr:hypothetical protein [Planctomycetota bacterium]
MKPISCLFLPALLLAPLAAQQSILAYLPKDTIAAATMPDLPGSYAEFQAMPLAKMWAEPDVQAFVGDLMAMLGKRVDEALGQAREQHKAGALPVDPDAVMSLRVQGMTAAITKLGLGMGDFGPQPEVGLMLHVNFGATAPTWMALLEMGLKQLDERSEGQLTRSETKVGEVKIVSYAPPEESGIKMGLHIAMLGRGIVIGTLIDEVRETVTAMAAKTPILGATPAFQSSLGAIDDKGAEMQLYLRPTGFLDVAMAGLGIGAEMGQIGDLDVEGVRRAIKAMGLSDLGPLAMSYVYADGKAMSRGMSATLSGDTAAATTAAAKTVDMSFLKWVPKDAVGLGSSMLDLGWYYDAVLRGVDAYDPEIGKKAREQIAAMEQQIGFKLRDDLVGTIGDHYAWWSLPMGQINAPPEATLLVKVTDEQRLVKALKALAALSDGRIEIEEGEKRGIKAYQVRLGLEDIEQFGGMNPLESYQPTFAFKNGYMVVCFTPSDVKRAFARLDRKEDEPKGDIRGSKEFASIAASMPQGVTSISYTDWKSTFESYYQMATGVLGFIPLGEDIPLDTAQIPDSATLTKHLFPSVSYQRTDVNGTVTTTTSPFGPEVYVLGALVAIPLSAAVVGLRNF